MIPRVRRAARLLGWMWFGTVVLLTVGLLVLRAAGGQVDLVESASMAPAIPRDAVAVTLPVDAEQIEVGDVITFRNGEDRLVLHRVTEILKTGDVVRFRTKGDANRSSDPLLIHQRGVERRLFFSVGGLGPLARGLQPPIGLLWLVALPAALLAIGTVGRPTGEDRPHDEGQDRRSGTGEQPEADRPLGPVPDQTGRASDEGSSAEAVARR